MQLRINTFVVIFVFLFWSSFPSVALAQVQEDGTTNTLVTTSGNTFVINGGTKLDGNLFHSFSEFSLPTNTEAFFNNLSTVDRVMIRVTGDSISHIDGLLKTNDSASLLIINPNGIVFGPNASLNIGGSFFASTADSVVFDDGSTFSATNPQAPPLLAVNIPIGLQFRDNPGQILVQSNGHNVSASIALGLPFTINNQSTGLQVPSGQTLALVGGDVNLEGGILRAESGKIELGSVSSGRVNLNQTSQGWRLDYGNASGFQNVSLSQKALADASGSGGGSIQVQGANVSLTDGSLLFIEHQGTQVGNSISINASESLKFIGSTSSPIGLVPSGAVNQTSAVGNGGEIKILTQRLLFEEGGAIIAFTFNEGRSGDIIVNASESIQSLGSLGEDNQSGIFNQTFGSGQGGDINVSTKDFAAINGGAILTQTNGSGSSGNVIVTAAESIEVIGDVPDSSLLTTISASTAGFGNAGTLTINTKRLVVREGATIVVSTFAQGDAGTLIVNASESVELSGQASSTPFNPTILGSFALITPESFRDFFGLPDEPSGATGSVTINTPRLTIIDGANVNISHEGSQGSAGNLEINTESVFLDNQGNISATTQTGTGGNILLNVQDLLQLRNNSFISANAGGMGNGGNINLNTNTLQVNNSNLSASTQSGRAGNLTIKAAESIQLSGVGSLSVEATQGGTAGNLTVETGQMSVSDRAKVTVSSPEGQAGNLTISANSLSLNRGSINAETGKSDTEEGANINLQLSDLLKLENESLISATANGNANGGNITINTPLLTVLPPTGPDGSDIIANAERGNGGNIIINAQGIFGMTEGRAIPGNQSNDIDASSKFGSSGQVEVNSTIDPNRGLIQLPETVVDPNALIAQNPCKRGSQSELTRTGRGGLPPSLNEDLSSQATQVELVQPAPMNSDEQENRYLEEKKSFSSLEPTPIVPAQGWIFNDKGEVVLTAYNPTLTRSPYLKNNPASCQVP